MYVYEKQEKNVIRYNIFQGNKKEFYNFYKIKFTNKNILNKINKVYILNFYQHLFP